MTILYKIFVVATIAVGVFSQDPDLCPGLQDSGIVKVEPPKITEPYRAKLQIHLVGKDQTMNVEFIKDVNHALIRIDQGGITTTNIYDSGRKQIISISSSPDGTEMPMCNVLPLGGNEWFMDGHDNSFHAVTGADWFFRLQNKQVKSALDYGTDTEDGVPVKRYSECLYWVKAQSTANITVSWTQSPWITPNGKDGEKVISVPLSMIVVGKQKDKDTGNLVLFEHLIAFYEFRHDVTVDMFNIPDGFYCPGLNSKYVKLPELPKHYSYDSEIVVSHMNSTLKEKIVLYQKHMYDAELKFTRYDFVPFADESNDPSTAHQHGSTVTQVHDFWTGVAYTFNNEGCKDGLIPEDSDDVTVVQGHHVMINDPLKALFGGQTFTYYKAETQRGIHTEQFRSIENDTLIVTELWLTSAKDFVQDSADEWMHRQPMKIVKYDDKNPWGDNRVEINIFNFDISKPSIFNYDVSQCYQGTNKRHFMFEFGGTLQQLNVKDKIGFKMQLLWAIVYRMFVTPIRIQRIELDSRDDHTHVIFTVLDKKPFGNAVDRPDNDLETDEAMKTFEKALNENTVNIGVPNATTPVVRGIPGTFREVDRMAENEIREAKEPKAEATTYSQIEMGFLGVGVLTLGFLIAFGAIFYVKPRVPFLQTSSSGGGDFAPRRFVNDPESPTVS